MENAHHQDPVNAILAGQDFLVIVVIQTITLTDLVIPVCRVFKERKINIHLFFFDIQIACHH